jgi:hypothetical protein
VSIVCALFTLIYILFHLFVYILCENSIRVQLFVVAELLSFFNCPTRRVLDTRAKPNGYSMNFYRTGSAESLDVSALWEEVTVAWSPAGLRHHHKMARRRRAHPRGARTLVSGLAGGATVDSHCRSLSVFLSTDVRPVKGEK